MQKTYLYHHGIKGQKWGIRRFENEDGSLTEEGKVRYGVDNSGSMSKAGRKQHEQDVRMENYRTNALRDIENRGFAQRSWLENDISKFDRKIEKAEFKGKTKKVDKLYRKQDIRKAQLAYETALHNLEKDKVMKMSIEELAAENKAINGLEAGRVALSILASSAASYYSGSSTAIITGHTKDQNRQARRITDEERYNLRKQANAQIAKEAEARRKRLGR